MPLDAGQQAKFEAWMNSKAKGARICPACSNEKWDVQEITAPPVVLNGRVVTPSSNAPAITVPSLIIVCESCGYQLSFNARKMGLL